MNDFQVAARDGRTGELIDIMRATSFPWQRRLSAIGAASCTIPLVNKFTIPQWRERTDHWNVLFEVSYQDRPLYGGFVKDRDLSHPQVLSCQLVDFWGLAERRGAWDHNHPNMEKWSLTQTVTLAQHAANATLRARTGPAAPSMSFPMTVNSFSSGTAVTQTWRGYHQETLDHVYKKLMAQGLDIYFEPRRLSNGDFDWVMRAGVAWSSGVEHEFSVTASRTQITGFREKSDGSRITNNARRVGEGSEEDMLVRSDRDLSSPYPLLDRVTQAKTVKSVAELSRQADADLAMYWRPTVQWEFEAPLESWIDVGDTVRLHFEGHPWIADGFHDRRVVAVSGDIGSSRVTVHCQATGGA